MTVYNMNANLTAIITEARSNVGYFSKPRGKRGVTPNTLYTRPKFPQLWIYFIIKNCQIIFPNGVYRTPPENAFMNVYFYFYCVVKCGNRALGINERIKKSSRTQKQTQTHHCREVIEGPAGDSYQKERVLSGQSICVKIKLYHFEQNNIDCYGNFFDSDICPSDAVSGPLYNSEHHQRLEQ
jgi:hypothetical protein